MKRRKEISQGKLAKIRVKVGEGSDNWDALAARGWPRPADAMAYVMAAHSHNCISMKSIPTEVLTLDQWEKELEALDRDYAVFLVEQAVKVSPLTQ